VASGSRHFSCAPCDFDVCFRCAVQCCSATPPPPSASPPQPPPPPPPEPFFFEQEWALCCKCEKWRRLAPGAPVPAEDEDWECSMNLDPAHNTCDDEEEEDEDEEAAAMRARATAAAGEQADEEADEAALRERAASFAAGAAMEHPEEVTAADAGEERVAGSEDEKSEGEEDEAEDAFGDATFEALKKQMQQQQQLVVSVDAESGEAASAAAAAAGHGAAGAADEEELRARRSTQPPSWADEPGYVPPGHEGFNAFARARMRRDGVPEQGHPDGRGAQLGTSLRRDPAQPAAHADASQSAHASQGGRELGRTRLHGHAAVRRAHASCRPQEHHQRPALGRLE
jgi:hypothetical protein